MARRKRDLAAAAMRPSQRLNRGRDKRLLLSAIGKCLKAQYDTRAAPVPPRLAELVEHLESRHGDRPRVRRLGQSEAK
jgi:hypothetical protein